MKRVLHGLSSVLVVVFGVVAVIGLLFLTACSKSDRQQSSTGQSEQNKPIQTPVVVDSSKNDAIVFLNNFFTEHKEGSLSGQWRYKINKFDLSNSGDLTFHVAEYIENDSRNNFLEYAVNLKNINPNAIKNNGLTIGLFCGGIDSCIGKRSKAETMGAGDFTESRVMEMYIQIASADEMDKKKAENAFNIVINKLK